MTTTETTAANPADTSTAIDEKKGAKVETKEATTTSEADNSGTDEAAETPAESEGEQKPKRKGGGFQNRIDRLTREREEARARAAELEKQLNGRNTVVDTADDSDPAPARPKESDFKSWDEFEAAKEEYITDKAAWKARQEVRAKAKEVEAKRLTDQAVSERRDAVRRFEKAAEALSETHEGLDEAIERFFNDKTMPISQPMADYIMLVSDRGPELVNALDADLDEAERISKLSPLAAARELARLEAKLPKPEARKVSNAPAPTKTVKGSAESPVKRLEDMSNAEYIAFRNKQELAARNFKANVQRR